MMYYICIFDYEHRTYPINPDLIKNGNIPEQTLSILCAICGMYPTRVI